MAPFGTVRMAAAVSEAGGIGSISMPSLVGDPDEACAVLRSHIAEVAALTTKKFAVNIGVGLDKESGKPLSTADALVDAVCEGAQDSRYAGRLAMLTTSGGSPEPWAERIRAAGLIHVHKVGSTRQALKAQEIGVDAVIASGYEMGGHTHHSPVHTFVLVPNVTAAVDIPVVLSGGARDGRTLAAALALGAEGVAMGTRFIVTEENDWNDAYKQRIIEAGEGEDTLFPAWFAPARGLQGPGID